MRKRLKTSVGGSRKRKKRGRGMGAWVHGIWGAGHEMGMRWRDARNKLGGEEFLESE